jgi:hypothetical protein
MTEKLSPEDDKKAVQLYKLHGLFAKHGPSSLAGEETTKKALAPLIANYDPNVNYSLTVHRSESPDIDSTINVKSQEELDKERYKLKLETDANLWEAHQHKQAHLSEYIETARQEAEEAGRHLNLRPPTEQQ